MSKQKKTEKTNAIRWLEKHHVPFELMAYDVSDGQLDGVSVAKKTNMNPQFVYKTLLTTAGDGLYSVCILPVAAELDFKKVARVANVKKLEMLPLKELTKVTGYKRGGCSPVGMKRLLPTFIDQSAEDLETIIVSAGKPGLQMKISPADLARMTNAQFCDMIKQDK